MPEPFAVLLDQNVPRAIATWLRRLRPSWQVYHLTEAGLAEKSDREVFDWAQAHQAIIITFDEDFADQRSFPAEAHRGIVRLRVWPTTIEETRDALGRLLAEVRESELSGSLVIVGRTRIRIRPRSPGTS